MHGELEELTYPTRNILNQIRDFVTLINRDYRYELANAPYCEAVGKPREAVIGATVEEVWGTEVFEKKIRPILETCFSGKSVEYIEQFPFGAFLRHMHVVFLPFRETEGEVTHCLVLSHDITHVTEIESRLTRYEYFDPLTGLFNRRSLDVVLDKEIFKTERGGSKAHHAVLFLQLRDFGRVNETYGAEIADLLIENTAVRIKEQVRDSDYVFRFEGSSIAVLLTQVANGADVAIVADKIHEAVTMPYQFRGITISLEAHIGIAVYPTNAETSGELVRCATAAVREAKRTGEAYSVYNRKLHADALARLRLKTELQAAFSNEEFELYFQPFVTAEGSVVGAEALIRWNHPTRGLLGPVHFIRVAEETGIVRAIDTWALFAVCRLAAAWVKHTDCFVSINLCAEDLLDENLPSVVEQALRQADDLGPGHLKLELTERIAMEEPEGAVRTIETLEKMGVEVWIDDFGSGISSLSYLRRLPARRLKIDKSFVDEIHTSDQERAYLGDIMSLVRTRGKGHVVEGVVNRDQLTILQEMGLELAQGFYFSPPLPADVFESLLQSRRQLPLKGDEKLG